MCLANAPKETLGVLMLGPCPWRPWLCSGLASCSEIPNCISPGKQCSLDLCFSMSKCSQVTINCFPSSQGFSSPGGVMAFASNTRRCCHLHFVPALVGYGGTFMSDASLQNMISWSSLDQGLKHKQYLIACRWPKTWICFIYASWKDVIQYAVRDLNIYSEQFPDKI